MEDKKIIKESQFERIQQYAYIIPNDNNKPIKIIYQNDNDWYKEKNDETYIYCDIYQKSKEQINDLE